VLQCVAVRGSVLHISAHLTTSTRCHSAYFCTFLSAKEPYTYVSMSTLAREICVRAKTYSLSCVVYMFLGTKESCVDARTGGFDKGDNLQDIIWGGYD